MNKFVVGGLLLPVIAMAVAGCSRKGAVRVQGVVEGCQADSTTIVLESCNTGSWVAVDTLHPDAGGAFAIASDAVPLPGVYRLNAGGRYIYFPVDSVATIDIAADMATFDTSYELKGSDEAALMQAVDKRLFSEVQKRGVEAVVADSLLKREIARKLLANPGSVAAYYIVNKQIGGRQLFSDNNRFDRRIIGAVANAYEQQRPGDPRTKLLTKRFLADRKTVMQAPEVSLLEIDLYGHDGKAHKLSEVAAKNRAVLLSFTNHSLPGAVAFNNAIHRVWKEMHPAGFEVYQVTVNDDESHWKSVAANLPWVSVFFPEGVDASMLMNYNVAAVPTTYLIVGGELKERVDDIDALRSTVAKYL